MLEKLQFRCLKIIQRKSRFESNDFFRKLPDYQSIENRFHYLNTNYIKKSLLNNNPLIEDLCRDYVNYSKSRVVTKISLLCKYKNLF
jgi:hypothetical protein